MKLNEQKKQKFVDWLESVLKRQCIDGFKCAICQSNDWAVLDEIVILKAIEGGRAYPNVGIMCTQCKHTVLFNATDSGVMDEDLDPSAIVCQECFKVEATMVNDNNVELCLECYHRDD